MPSGQAGMQLPLPLHTEAQRTASALPLPPVIKSTIPAVVSAESAWLRPSGATIGQALKHAPQRVQASAIASPRALKSSIYPAATVLSLIPSPGIFKTRDDVLSRHVQNPPKPYSGMTNSVSIF